MDFFSEQKFGKPDKISKGDYSNCEFLQCDFANTDLSNYRFSDCEFKDCDFSNAKIPDVVFGDVIFQNCKMIGLNFEEINQFNISFRFQNCILNHSSFYGTDIRKTIFNSCSLIETDFTESNLSHSAFTNSNLTDAVFERTNLEYSDLSSAINFSIDPNQNQLRKARFSRDSLSGLLYQLNIIID